MVLLSELADQGAFSNILDIGCGSGILSLQAGLLWPAAHILAVDIEASAIEATRTNAARNQLEGRITALQGDGFSRREVQGAAPYDLIIANILAEPLVALAHQFTPHLRPQGLALVSGILAWQWPQVEAAFKAAGLTYIHHLEEQGWVAAVMQNQL